MGAQRLVAGVRNYAAAAPKANLLANMYQMLFADDDQKHQKALWRNPSAIGDAMEDSGAGTFLNDLESGKGFAHAALHGAQELGNHLVEPFAESPLVSGALGAMLGHEPKFSWASGPGHESESNGLRTRLLMLAAGINPLFQPFVPAEDGKRSSLQQRIGEALLKAFAPHAISYSVSP